MYSQTTFLSVPTYEMSKIYIFQKFNAQEGLFFLEDL